MKNTGNQNYTLENFQGPLDFLIYLIQRNEIQIFDVPVHEIVQQFLAKWQEIEPHLVESGAEFIGNTASLLFLKSRMLLPKHEQDAEIEEEDPQFEIIYKLIDYCRFKQIARELGEREKNESVFYPRGQQEIPTLPKKLGIEHVSLEDFAQLFQTTLEQAAGRQGVIKEELWRVADKIRWFRDAFKVRDELSFKEIFQASMPKVALIVTFLAVLELMKEGDIFVIKKTDTEEIALIPNPEERSEKDNDS